MICYALACEAGHGFESWFRSSDDFDAQAKRGLVACPVCNSVKVQKQVMAPRLARTDRAEVPEAPAIADEAAPVALVDDKARALRALIGEFRKQLAANSEDVGSAFAEEARKIHYGESEERSIHGQATAKEAQALAEEGVGFLPLPMLPDERN